MSSHTSDIVAESLPAHTPVEALVNSTEDEFSQCKTTTDFLKVYFSDKDRSAQFMDRYLTKVYKSYNKAIEQIDEFRSRNIKSAELTTFVEKNPHHDPDMRYLNIHSLTKTRDWVKRGRPDEQASTIEASLADIGQFQHNFPRDTCPAPADEGGFPLSQEAGHHILRLHPGSMSYLYGPNTPGLYAAVTNPDLTEGRQMYGQAYDGSVSGLHPTNATSHMPDCPCETGYSISYEDCICGP